MKTTPKITAKQEGGDDGYCYVVRVNGRVFVDGLTRAEVPYYKAKARKRWEDERRAVAVPDDAFGHDGMLADKPKKIAAVRSLAELATLARTDKRYEELAIVAARNLGGSGDSLPAALRVLELNAMETDERGVVGEINFCRNLVGT